MQIQDSESKSSRFVAGSYCSWPGVWCFKCQVIKLRVEQPQETIFLEIHEVGWLI